ncbi:MAG TPA: hypothetical protein VN032_01870, partial [Thermoanaerobaculia bacterium]|nr:hypothetical protein [Thermoanaerobaculia bacterium]
MSRGRDVPVARRICLFLFAAAWAARAPGATDPAYAALRAATPRGPGFTVQNLVLERDVFRFRFEKGVFQFLAPVEGRVTGAVFVGTGSWELHPATEIERQHLALVAGEKGLEVLTDRFETLVLLFTDGSEAEIRRAGVASETAPDRGTRAWDAYRRSERKDVKTNFEIRILEDVLGKAEPAGGVFLALLDGGRLPRAVAVVDPAGLEWLAPGILTGDEDSALFVIPEQDAGFWYLCRRKSELASPAGHPEPFRADHYDIDSRIEETSRLSGTTTIRLEAAVPGRRVLPLHLAGRLRIQDAEFAIADGKTWEAAAVIQEKEDEDSDAAVVFPRAPLPGEPWLLRLHYGGKDVLRNRGDGNYAVGARENWYPNLGTFRTLATFDLIYRVPKGNQVVSVGERVDDQTVGELQVSTWKARRPIRVAGFNYGKFRRIEKDDAESGLKIEVYTNPGTPDIVREINEALNSRSPAGIGAPPRVDAENYWGTP